MLMDEDPEIPHQITLMEAVTEPTGDKPEF